MLDFLTDKARSVYAKTRNDWRKKPVLDILACCPVGDDVVWRISIDHKVSLDPWHQDDIPDIRKEEDSASTEVAVLDAARMDEVELICYDKTGGLLPITPIQFEDQLIQYDDAIKRHQVYSIRLSAKTEALSFEARVNGAKGTLTIGFDRWRHYVQDALHLRRDAWYQPDYDRWLRAHPDYADVDCTNVYSLPETHVMVMGDDVLLAPCAFERMAQTLTEYPDALAVYADSDSIDRFGRRVHPLFKPDFSPEYLCAVNYVGEFIVVRRDVFDAAKTSLEKQEEQTFSPTPYECALQAAKLADEQGGEVIHIPQVLFHSMRDPEASDNVFQSMSSVAHEQLYADAPQPSIDIIIPSKDHVQVLDNCISSILERAAYQNYRILVVENNSCELETFEYYEQIMKRDERVSVVCAESSPDFNYSRLINFGAAQGVGEYLLLLNNDTEVIDPFFMQHMLEPFDNPHVGVVGAKLFFRDGLVQHVGMLIGPDGTVVHVNQDEEDSWPGYMGRNVYPTNVSAVTGACQLVSRHVFDRVGGYSEQFAVGYNDADFCCKVRSLGKRVVMQPEAKLYHFEFTSRGREENDPVKLERWKCERDLFQRTWPRFFTEGDPYSNPNLDKDSRYFSLPNEQ